MLLASLRSGSLIPVSRSFKPSLLRIPIISHLFSPFTTRTGTITMAGKKKANVCEAAPVEPAIQDRANRILAILEERFPKDSLKVPLDHGSPFQLLVAVMLSAQSTDKKVNEVTPALFAAAPDAETMAAKEPAEVERFIKQVGLAPTKAKNIVKMSQLLLDRHAGAVPDSIEALEALPGVGHKTASVVMIQAFQKAAFPVDTHIHRLAQRWGLTSGKSVEQTEADLKALYPEDTWHSLHLQIIFFGREFCPAQGHEPKDCPICSICAVEPYHRPGMSPLRPGESIAARGDLRAALHKSPTASPARRLLMLSPAGKKRKAGEEGTEEEAAESKSESEEGGQGDKPAVRKATKAKAGPKGQATAGGGKGAKAKAKAVEVVVGGTETPAADAVARAATVAAVVAAAAADPVSPVGEGAVEGVEGGGRRSSGRKRGKAESE